MRKSNPYQRIKHGFENFPMPTPLATLNMAGGFLLEEGGDFALDELGHLKLAKSVDSGRVGDIVFTFNTTLNLGNNWMEASGQAMNKTSYPELFNVIGYKYGGSGNTFYLPNFKNNGWFVRSYTSSNAVGSTQIDAIRNITGSINNLLIKNQSNISPNGTLSFEGTVVKSNAWTGSLEGSGYSISSIDFNASNSVPTAEENRPVNIAMRVLIKVR